MTREELQIQSLSLIKQSNRVALQWCTGLGKSKIAIDMANYLTDKEFKEHEEPFNVLLVVAETAHKSNWKIEFDRWGLKTNNIVMECYASLKKYRNSYWDLVIFDEIYLRFWALFLLVGLPGGVCDRVLSITCAGTTY